MLQLPKSFFTTILDKSTTFIAVHKTVIVHQALMTSKDSFVSNDKSSILNGK